MENQDRISAGLRILSKSREPIHESELEEILNRFKGIETWEKVLIESSEINLFAIMAQYIHFNTFAGAGVATVAGQIAAQVHLFKNHQQPIDFASDTSYIIARGLFYAGIEEFGGVDLNTTHREMAQRLLQYTGIYFNLDIDAMNRLASPIPSTVRAMEEMKKGFGIGIKVSELALFERIGFQLGSEDLADKEYTKAYRILKSKYPPYLEFLNKNNALAWIPIHARAEDSQTKSNTQTSLELYHFDQALKSANRAIVDYVGDVTDPREFTIKGYVRFAAMHERFMKGLSRHTRQ